MKGEWWTILYDPELFELKLFNAGLWLSFLASLLGWSRYRRLNVTQQRVTWFTTFSFLLEFASSHAVISHLVHDDTNSFWYHAGVPVLFWLICRLQLDQLSARYRPLLATVFPLLFLVLAVIQALYLIPIRSFPTVTIGAYAVAGFTLPIVYFLALLRRMNVEYVEEQPLFWVSVGMMVYFSANFLLWCALTFLVYDKAAFWNIYRINAYAGIFLYGCFIVALLLPRPQLYSTIT